MVEVYRDDWLALLGGDARVVLDAMPARSVQTCVTSPPYYGLRAYGTEGQVWGGDPDHAHVWGAEKIVAGPSQAQGATSQRAGRSNVEAQSQRGNSQGRYCACGAWCGELGLEPSPAQYVDHIVEVCRAIWRVLRDDGTLWLNLGDSYAVSSTYSAPRTMHTEAGWKEAGRRPAAGKPEGVKPKDLLMIPADVARALRADGWYLRRDIIWAKPNPMPESVDDRPTSSHEYLYLLAKREDYYYDAVAVREQRPPNEIARSVRGYRRVDSTQPAVPPGAGPHHGLHLADKQAATGAQRIKGGDRWGGFNERWDDRAVETGRNLRSVWEIPEDLLAQFLRWLDDQPAGSLGDVWRIATQPYPGAHFATFPEKLVEPAILAGTSARGACPECGAPWSRETKLSTTPRDMSRPQAQRAVELASAAGLTEAHLEAIRSAGATDAGKAQVTQTGTGKNADDVARLAAEAKAALGGYYREFLLTAPTTVGWRPGCAHYPRTAEWPRLAVIPDQADGETDEAYDARVAPDYEALAAAQALRAELLTAWEPERTVPCVVLDPFGGSGTVGRVAQRLSRRAVLVDLHPDYLDQQMDRNRQAPLGLLG